MKIKFVFIKFLPTFAVFNKQKQIELYNENKS